MASSYLRKAFLEVVENQIRDNDPPETRETLDRLMADGHSRAEATDLIGQATAVEVHTVLKKQGQFDRKRFVRNLKALPKEPEE